MNTMLKKTIANILTVLMLFSFLPTIAYANTSQPISVSLEIKGDSKMGTIYNEKVEVQKEETAFDVLKRICDENNIKLDYDGQWKFVTGINGLSQLDDAPNSGWLYKVNGISPNVGAGDYVLNAGDHVLFYFTLDYTMNEENDNLDEKPQTDMDTISSKIKRIATIYKSKQVISDWEALALVLSGESLERAKQTELLNNIKVSKGEMRLPTDRAKKALLLQIAGIDITNIAGIDLLEKIYNDQGMGKQGLNGYIFSLMVMSNANIPETAKMSIDKVIQLIIGSQNDNGGFPLVIGKKSDLDITAMAITALAPYSEKNDVKDAIEKAVNYLRDEQDSKGGYIVWGEKSSEIISQIIIGLTANNINPDNEGFVKEGKTLMNVLLDYQQSDGKFSNLKGRKSNDIATEQAIQALISYKRFFEKEPPIYISLQDSLVIDLEESQINFTNPSKNSDWPLNHLIRLWLLLL